jgi:hypothetical protein
MTGAAIIVVLIWIGILGLMFYARDPLRYWTRIVICGLFGVVIPIYLIIVEFVEPTPGGFVQWIIPELLIICLFGWCLKTGIKNRKAYLLKQG